MIEPEEFLRLWSTSVVELIGDQIKGVVSAAALRIETALLLSRRPAPIAQLSANMGYDIANPDLSGGGIQPAFNQDVRRWALMLAPRGTGACDVFFGFENSPRSVMRLNPNRPHKVLFSDFGPAMQQSIRVQCPTGDAAMSLWSVYIIRQ
jgi:hypothetical protein